MKRAVFLLLFALPLFASAQTALDPARQIVILTNQLNVLRAKLLPATENFFFTRDLFTGLRNDGDVRRLQEVFALLGLFPDALIGGNFGPITRTAVQNYQAARGIIRTGYAGPLTRGALNQEPALTYRNRPRPDYDLAALAHAVQDGVNAARRATGLSELLWDGAIAEVARRHSEDQAKDNAELTDSNLLCAYPLIRHENFSGAFKVGDRLEAAGIAFRRAGENIVSFSPAENIFYRAPDDLARDCPEAREFPPAVGALAEREALYRAVLAERTTAARASPVVVWINKAWMTPERVSANAVSEWMDSPGHRANILTPEFTRGGVGVAWANEFLIITHALIQ